jgi:hypothetical protein
VAGRLTLTAIAAVDGESGPSLTHRAACWSVDLGVAVVINYAASLSPQARLSASHSQCQSESHVLC